jgi:hypothetical protein
MLRSIDDTTAPILQAQLGREKDSGVRRLIQEGLAMGDLDDSLPAQRRLAAIQALSGSLNLGCLQPTGIAGGSCARMPIPRCGGAAAKAMTRIESWRSFYGVHRDTVLRLQPGLRAGAVGHRPRPSPSA